MTAHVHIFNPARRNRRTAALFNKPVLVTTPLPMIMKKSFFLKAVIRALLFASVIASGQADIVAWGDSLTYGTGADHPDKGEKTWPKWFTEFSGVQVNKKGVGGESSSQIKKRMLAEPELHKDFTVIWAGRNDFQGGKWVLKNISEMVQALGHNNFLIVGIPNGTMEPKGSPAWELINTLNADLRSIYGVRFVDVRPLLVSAYDKTGEQDVIDHDNDVTPSSLRSDKLHLNTAGYKIVAQAIYDAYQKVAALNTPSSPIPPGAAALGYTKCVIDEKPVVADIAPAGTGNYKWFRGAVWSTNNAPITNYTDTNGILTLLQKGDGKTPSMVGAPHDFDGGVLPRLSGASGFYIEYDVRLSDNDPDHWPAVWLMPAEHNGGNGQPVRDVYPEDPAGYERWMELDVDEGGFRPGSLASVISWQGIWSKGGYAKITCNSWNKAGATLDRTQIHTFGASYDPINSRVTWWLDGVKYFTADNSVLAGCVPAIAKKQHFYPIIGAQTHKSKVPYSMFVSSVRAYIPPQ